MNIILLSGGSGKRLWPLSNDARSKQFLEILNKEDGTKESMLQHMYRSISELAPDSCVTVAASQSQVSAIKEQLGNNVDISIEPCRRDTFPAIVLAAAFLHDKKDVMPDEPVIVCPADSYVDDNYFRALKEMNEHVKHTDAALVLMGIEPYEPSEKYGYIIPENKEHISKVSKFREKPDRKAAERYIAEGGLWNAGVFGFRLEYILDFAVKEIGTSAYDEILKLYENLEKISFDYAVVEKTNDIDVIRFDGLWKDIGTWDSLSEVMEGDVTGNVTLADSENTTVINNLHMPLVALGVSNLAIAATHDGILVTDKQKSEYLKDYVNNQRPMYEKRCWGEYKVLEAEAYEDGISSLTKHLVISPGEHISYQIHVHRTEIWTVVEGKGKLIIDGKISTIGTGDVVKIEPGVRHAIKAETRVHIIEVQLGSPLIEEDITRLDWNWGSI